MSNHAIVSFIKSCVRVVGYFLLMLQNPMPAVVVLVISEAIGVLEELFEK